MVNFGTNYAKCMRNFSPLKIVQDGQKISASTDYCIFDKVGKKVGEFQFCDNGYVCGLELVPEIRRKKTASDAILSVKDFVIQKAREMGLDCIRFLSAYNNQHNVRRLYGKLGADVVSEKPEGCLHVAMVPVDEKEFGDFIKEFVTNVQNKISSSLS